ncbi:MAG: molybdopterin-guanine dinucleotide biosynthesis protein B [Deltaproteobacteria bacterium]|nr:molybdopterin-guanine dinucleotide biosynthesis protein B [Deltaproteobacteria bacterium]
MIMPPVITIVGHSNSGKTTLIEKLIPELKRRGYRVGTIKHAHHGFSMDQKGKDTYRHRAAGADAVLAASPGQIALVKSMARNGLDSLLPYFQDMDIVLVEGFKQEKKTKIEVFRSQINQTTLFPEDDLLVAIVTDSPYSARVPVFQFEDIQAICNLIETHSKLGLE